MESIIQDLLYTNLTQKQISEKYGISRTTVTAINRGQNFK
jgi:Trp operon repressor